MLITQKTCARKAIRRLEMRRIVFDTRAASRLGCPNIPYAVSAPKSSVAAKDIAASILTAETEVVPYNKTEGATPPNSET